MIAKINDFENAIDYSDMKIYISGSITKDQKSGKDWKGKFLKYQELLLKLFPNATFFNSANEISACDIFPKDKKDLMGLTLEDWQYRTVMMRDISELMKCDAIAFIPDWKYSQGAKCEMEVATCLKMKKIFLPKISLK